LATNPIHK